MSDTPLVRITGLRKYFAVKGGWLGGRRGQVHATLRCRERQGRTAP